MAFLSTKSSIASHDASLPVHDALPIHLPIHLTHLPGSTANLQAPLYAHKSSSFQSTAAPPLQSRMRRPTWDQVEEVVWAAIPLLFHLVAVSLLAAVMFSYWRPFLTLTELGGTGRLEYGILGSCAIAPGTTTTICTSKSIYADFVPSILLIAPTVPGYATLKLPLSSTQSPIIFLCAFLATALSFALYLPLWLVLYFPTSLPAPVVRLIRHAPRAIYTASGVLAFTAMILTVTIGVGYKLLLIAGADEFALWLQNGIYAGLAIPGQSAEWSASIGPAFDIVWIVVVCQALSAIGANVALHNAMDERIEGMPQHSGSW